ncbi:MAG: DUF2145 domain-containing protein [Gammaproteobacteria bacterium WSBS_2016_MAG_OTU1]
MRYLFIVCLVLATGIAQACPQINMGVEGHRKAAQLADKVRAYLKSNNVRVALLGRAGSDAPEKRFVKKIGIWNYTHAGLIYRNHPDGEWTVVHLRNICGEESGVFAESLLSFYLDNPHEYRTVVAVPTAALQDNIESLVIEQDIAAAYRDKSIYSSISYPYSLERQNSNEYILDLLSAALAQMNNKTATNRRTAKEYFLSSAYRDEFPAEILKVGFIELLGASIGLGPDNATLDDHTPSERAAGNFQFVAVGSLIQFIDNLGLLEATEEFALDDIRKARDTIIIEE